MDFLVATEVGKFPPKWMTIWRSHRGWLRCAGRRWWGFMSIPFCSLPFLSLYSVYYWFCSISQLSYIYQRRWRVVGGNLRDLASSPRGEGGIRSCHTLIRVHTVWINNNNNHKHCNYSELSDPCNPFWFPFNLQQTESYSQQTKIWKDHYLCCRLDNFKVELFNAGGVQHSLLNDQSWIE